MRRARPLLLALLLAGCPRPDPIGGEDAGVDGGLGTDGGSSGLTFEFVDEPGIPTTQGGVTITDMDLSLKDLRVIGDAADGTGPSYLATHVLSWEDSLDATGVTFSAAPAGIYSRFATQVATSAVSSHSFRLRGTVTLDGVTYDFEIEDEAPLDLELDLGSLPLDPGDDVTVRVRCDLAEIALSLDWGAVPPDGDELNIDASSPLIGEIRAQVAQSLEILEVID